MYLTKLTNKFSHIYPVLKRGVDVIGSLILLVLTAPIMAIAYLAVVSTSKGPGIFWSKRVGYDGRIFVMPKLRSMSSESKIVSREVATDKDITVTRVGRFIRRTSIDELPQFWSVLIGDMSLIGPRPLLVNDYARPARDARPSIYTVKPGITGLAQVRGRNFVSPANKSRYDKFYAERVCIMLDIRIALKTINVVLRPKSIL